MSMNDELTQLYNDYFINKIRDLSSDELQFSTPFLLKPNTSYELSKQKIMIVGQETYTWYGKFAEFLSNESPINYAQNVYSKFHEEESTNYNSPFWSYINKLFENSDYHWIWNNVFKLETVEYLSDEKHLGKKVSLSVLNKNKKYRYLIDKIKSIQKDIFLKELEILKPDVVIFFTGNPYDNLFMDWQFDTQKNFYQEIPEAFEIGIDKWKFGRLCNPLLPQKTFRTYHPNYLRRVSKKVITPTQKEFIFNYLKSQISK